VKPKHTPGPWTQTSLSYTIVANQKNIGSDNYTADLITEVASNNEADARLIAAAPDLLEALEALVCRVNELVPDAHAACLKQIDNAIFAIIKARGES
jgi:hypothetical protein